MAKIEICGNCSNCSPAGLQRCECISVPKIFDQCRLQICLTPGVVGPAKVDTSPSPCSTRGCKNFRVIPPASATSVTAEHFCIKNIAIVNKTRSAFKNGCYDVTVKFTFGYCLVFFDDDSCEIRRTPACSSYTTTVTLYGGEDICVAMMNELYDDFMQNGPFASVDASAVPLSTELRYPRLNDTTCRCCCGKDGCCCICGPSSSVCGHNSCSCGCGGTGPDRRGCDGVDPDRRGCGDGYDPDRRGCGDGYDPDRRGCGDGYDPDRRGCGGVGPAELNPIGVDITIGLFAVVKLLRLSNVSVHSYGNCVPCDCSNVSSDVDDPCEFFNSLNFPTGLFAPQTRYTPCSSEGTANVSTGNGKCCDKNC
jgi:hypothetical protein